MEKLTSDLLIGVVSGFIASVIIFVFNLFWLKVIRPWWENSLYSDARIEGRWKSNSIFLSGNQTELWKIRQVGHKITGNILVLDGADQGKEYLIEGTFDNLMLTAIYKSKSKDSIDKGTITLMLINNGKTLKGCGKWTPSVGQ